nr:unnamed protein product [Spirometra erinaceieuropaei]
MADRLMEMHGFSKPSLSALSTPPASALSKLEIGLTKLDGGIASLQRQTLSPSSQSQSKLPTPHVHFVHPARSNTAVTCWNHITFGAKARRCIYPCSTSIQSKRVNPKVSAANLPDSFNPGRTFYVHDNRSGRRFLVDIGAQLSVIPPTPAGCQHIGLRRLFPWVFVVGVLFSVQTSSPLSIFWSTAVSPVYMKRPPTSPFGVSLPPTLPLNSPLWTLNTRVHFGNLSASILRHDVVHNIRTTGPPVFSRPHSLAPARLVVARAEFEHVLQTGIIRQSEISWTSPLHVVPKAATGDWHPCGDYRVLNNVTVPDRYPVPHLQMLACALVGKSVFSKTDLIRAFHQIPIAPEDVSKTVVTTPLASLSYCACGWDSITPPRPFRASSTAEEHREHLATVFDRLQQFGIVLNPSKCVFGVPSLEFSSHLVDSHGIHPLPSKVAAIRDFPPPSSNRQLQRFLDMVNFYRRFLPHCADTLLPHTSLLHDPKHS